MHVVLTTDTPRYLRWANQFVAHSSSDRARVIFPRAGADRAAALPLYEQAARQAGQDGRVIISVGHGGVAGSGTTAMIDLVPESGFRLTEALLADINRRESDALIIQRVGEMAGGRPGDEFCTALLNPPRRGPRVTLPEGLEPMVARARCGGLTAATERTAVRLDYDRLGASFARHGVAEVMLLTCNVGNAPDFMTRLATDWRVTILAYRERIVADEDGVDNRTRIYREGHGPVVGSRASLRCETEPPERFVSFSPSLSP